MQDHASGHASKYTSGWLKNIGFGPGEKLMELPPNLPDINQIENFLALLKKMVLVENVQYTSLEPLWKAIQKAAASISSTEIATLTAVSIGGLRLSWQPREAVSKSRGNQVT